MVIYDKKRGELTFICNKSTNAKMVYLVGNFNNWNPSIKQMTKFKDGSFRARMKLPAGNYEYKFVADKIWMEDPDVEVKVQNPFGSTNSVVKVS